MNVFPNKNILKKSLLDSVLFTSVVLLIVVFLLRASEYEENTFKPTKITHSNYQSPNEFLTHKLLDKEVKYGLTRIGQANEVKYQIDQFVSNVPFIPNSIDQRYEVMSILRFVGNWIEKRNIYKPSTDFGQGFLTHELDCDLRSYIYHAVAQKLKINNFHIYYKPGHAFVAWEGDNDQLPIYWETTNNPPEEISTKIINKWFKKQKNPYDLIALNNSEYEAHLDFHVVTRLVSENETEKAQILINKIAELYPENLLFAYVRALLEKDTSFIEANIDHFPAEYMAHAELANLYYEDGNHELSAYYLSKASTLSRITDNVIDLLISNKEVTLLLKLKAGLYYLLRAPMKWITDNNTDQNNYNFTTFILLLGFLCSLVVFTLGIFRRDNN